MKKTVKHKRRLDAKAGVDYDALFDLECLSPIS